ncbi:hypothetical protein JJB79_16430 [Pantoea eucrina]|uniref:Antitoxin n=1 Tax=Pantoea eucrina TaxID=472693 RepID=A0ABS1Z963_9GAMM|nr:hypothetical protein [Pantoea eucrina]AIX52373.1 hypothetical protein PSNIH1_19220 [Pantoea sp. PSNIH1]MBM0748979.1 hypothetical protein [Pantoea eucrina]QNH53331.1 hypothetical protein HWI77_19175 [Acinetobacter venetianus]
MKTIDSSTAHAAWDATIDTALNEPVKITRQGESVVMVSGSLYETLQQLLLEKDMEYLLERHAGTFKALADR